MHSCSVCLSLLNMKMENVGFIGVHVGAGKYSTKSAPLYEKLCRVACKRATEMLKSGKSALEAVTVATAILEDSSLTNAGYGSNLTINGHVECDASIMDGFNLSFGAVGAVSGVKNPICLAKKICCNQNNRLALGRIPPCVVVGPGALELAQNDTDIITVFPESLVSGNALKLHQKFKTQLMNNEKRDTVLVTKHQLEYDRMDTVGAVSIDKEGRTAAACSSGGILLKQPGRIGQAAMYGCGCWAQDKLSEGEASIAVVTSGCGEHIMKTVLAREVANRMRISDGITCVTLKENIDTLFLNSQMLKNIDEKLCGMLVLKHNDYECEFLWAHTTPSLCIGYMDTASNKAKSRISKLSCLAQVGKAVAVEGVSAFAASG